MLARPSTGWDLARSWCPGLLSLWLVPRIGRFSEQFPGIRLHLSGSNDPADIYDPEIDLCIHYGHGSCGDCWSRHWSDLELFPVASPTLLNARPLRSIRDLTDHFILHSDVGLDLQPLLPSAMALDIS